MRAASIRVYTLRYTVEQWPTRLNSIGTMRMLRIWPFTKSFPVSSKN